MARITTVRIDPSNPREPDPAPPDPYNFQRIYYGANLDSLPAPAGLPGPGQCPDHPDAPLAPSAALAGAVYCTECKKLFRAIPKWLAPIYDAAASVSTATSSGVGELQSKVDEALQRVATIEQHGVSQEALDAMRGDLESLKVAYAEHQARLEGVSANMRHELDGVAEKLRQQFEHVLDAVPQALEMKGILARLKGAEQQLLNIEKRHDAEDSAHDRRFIIVGAVAGILGVAATAVVFWLQRPQ